MCRRCDANYEGGDSRQNPRSSVFDQPEPLVCIPCGGWNGDHVDGCPAVAFERECDRDRALESGMPAAWADLLISVDLPTDVELAA